MHSLLANDTADSLRHYLFQVLPEIDKDWWTKLVTPSLSFQQQRMVEEKKVDSLTGLDLAALLRVLDKNWYEVSSRRTLGNEAEPGPRSYSTFAINGRMLPARS